MLALVTAVLLATDAGAGDSTRGQSLYLARCGACHSLSENGAGPSHRDVFGRRAATQPGFDYSEALKRSGLVWTAEALDRWLRDPNALVPGNAMRVQLATEPVDRADIIAFLERVSVRRSERPQQPSRRQ